MEAKSEHVTESGCRIWTGPTFNGGYGRLTTKHADGEYRSEPIHRIAWREEKGPIPDGMLVLHKCDTPACFRVDHLFLGTSADNSADMVSKGRSLVGESGPNSKLTEKQVMEIREDSRSHGEVAEHYGISKSHVQRIRYGKSKP